MIETNAQAIKALREIISKTGWSYRYIGEKTGVHFATIARIANGDINKSHKGTMKEIYKLQLMVRGME